MASDLSDYEALLAATSVDVDRLISRLQTLTDAAWRTRREPVIGLLVELVGVQGELESTVPPPLPDLATFALADAMAVIAGDLLDSLKALAQPTALDSVATRIRATLAATA